MLVTSVSGLLVLGWLLLAAVWSWRRAGMWSRAAAASTIPTRR
jgi:hypothetical protein